MCRLQSSFGLFYRLRGCIGKGISAKDSNLCVFRPRQGELRVPFVRGSSPLDLSPRTPRQTSDCGRASRASPWTRTLPQKDPYGVQTRRTLAHGSRRPSRPGSRPRPHRPSPTYTPEDLCRPLVAGGPLCMCVCVGVRVSSRVGPRTSVDPDVHRFRPSSLTDSRTCRPRRVHLRKDSNLVVDSDVSVPDPDSP